MHENNLNKGNLWLVYPLNKFLSLPHLIFTFKLENMKGPASRGLCLKLRRKLTFLETGKITEDLGNCVCVCVCVSISMCAYILCQVLESMIR